MVSWFLFLLYFPIQKMGVGYLMCLSPSEFSLKAVGVILDSMNSN